MMRKGLCITIAVIMIVSMAACGAPVSPETASIAASGDSSAVVVFADPVLEARVRAAMGKPEGDITAAEAEAVTEMNFGLGLWRQISGAAQIKDLSGLEYFKNVESLDLSFNAVADISPLVGLTKLTSLSLGGNPVADISPLSGMTSLRALTLSGCAAQDYSPLAGLVTLEFLMLDSSAITDLSVLSGMTGLMYLNLAHTQVSDVTPLSALTSLTQLYIAECPVSSFSPLMDIYPNLKGKDFTIASSLSELGFTRPDNSVWANYSAGNLSVNINHSEWGIPEMDMEADTIRLSLNMDGGTGLTVGCDPAGHQNYVFSISQNGEHLADYVYISSEDSLMFDGDREAVENAIRAILGDTGSGDILLAPITAFNDTIRETFGMTADALFALPFGPPTLLNLGFVPDMDNAVCLYVQREPWDYSVAVHRPEWGEQDYDVQFFTPLSDEYRIVVSYIIDERKFIVKADDNDGDSASFEYFIDTSEHVDVWCSNDEMTVEEYFKNAINAPEAEDVYLYSVQLMENYISDTFGMTIEELYALPVGE